MKKYCFLTYIAFALSPLLLAQDLSEDTKTLESITTQDISLDGTSWKSEDLKNNPGSRSIISNRQLRQSGQKSIDSALQQVPGIQIRDYTGTGILPKLEFRGFGGAGNGHSNTGMILLDGNNIYGAPYSNIELALFPISFMMVDHIDYIKGGASVQYGPNTFSGVLNIISKPIPKTWENLIAQKVTIWGKDKLSYRGNGDFGNNVLYNTYLKTGGMINEHFGIDLQADIINGQSFRANSPTKVQNLMARAVYEINQNHKLNGFVQYYNYLANDPGTLSTLNYFKDRFQNLRPNNLASGDAKRAGITYNYYFGKDESLDGNFSLNYYFHDVLRNFEFDNNFNAAMDTITPPKTITSNVRRFEVQTLEPKVNLNINGSKLKQNIVFGLRYTFERVKQDSFEKMLSNSAITYKPSNNFANNYLAAYLSDEFKILDSLSITPGLRYEFINASYTGSSEPKIQNQFNPALSLAYKPIKSLIVYANYSRSFLPPQTTGDIAGTNFYHTSTFQNIEGGVRYFINSIFSINANYFAIFANKYRIGNFSADSSGADALSQGAELEAYISPFRGFDIHLAYTFIDARVTQHQTGGRGSNGYNGDIYGKKLPYVSPHSFSFDMIYDIPKIFTLGISGFYYSKSYSDIANTENTGTDGKGGSQPDYFVLNAQISRTLWQSGKQKINGSISVNNIFNANYYFRGIGTSPVGRQPAPGRSISFFLSYAF